MCSHKICHITSVHNPFDTRIYRKECTSLASRGFDVTLIVVNAGDVSSDIPNLRIINVDVSFTSRFSRILKAPGKVLKVAKSVGAEIYHFHDPELLLIAGKLKSTGARVIYDAHEDVPKQILTKDWIPKPFRMALSGLVKTYENLTVQKIDAVITVVEGISSRMEALGVKCELVKNYPDTKQLPSPSDWQLKENLVCYVGDLTRIRGIFELVEAAGIAKVSLVLGGRWSEQNLKSKAQASKGWAYTNYLGFLSKDDVQDTFARSKIGVVLFHPAPNHIDALPNKLFEYLAAGIPVVASNFGWLEHIVSEYKCGITVDPKKPKEIAEAFERLLANDEDSREMGKRGREAVMKHFNWETEEAKLHRVYLELLK